MIFSVNRGEYHINVLAIALLNSLKLWLYITEEYKFEPNIIQLQKKRMMSLELPPMNYNQLLIAGS